MGLHYLACNSRVISNSKGNQHWNCVIREMATAPQKVPSCSPRCSVNREVTVLKFSASGLSAVVC